MVEADLERAEERAEAGESYVEKSKRKKNIKNWIQLFAWTNY